MELIINMKKKYFLTQKQIEKIIRNYGGYHIFHKNTILNASEEKINYDRIVFKRKDQSGMLTINSSWNKEKNLPRILVYISDKSGKIYRTDYWEFFSDIVSGIYFSHTLNKDGSIISEFESLSINSQSKQKLTNIQKLQKEIEQLKITILEKDTKINQLEALLQNYQQTSSFIIENGEKVTKPSLEDCIEMMKNNIELNKATKSSSKTAGRPEKYKETEIEIMRRLKKEGYSMRQIASQIGCCPATVYNKLKKYEKNIQR